MFVVLVLGSRALLYISLLSHAAELVIVGLVLVTTTVLPESRSFVTASGLRVYGLLGPRGLGFRVLGFRIRLPCRWRLVKHEGSGG